jgi:hypothetical protein
MLYAYLHLIYVHSKYCRSNISMKSLFLLLNSRKGESYWLILSLAYFLLLEHHHMGAKYCSMHIQNMPGVDRCAFKMWRELLYIFYYVGTWSNTPGLIMKIEQLPPYFECVLSRLGNTKSSSKHIQN